MSKLISIIIATYNAEKTLRRCLNSIVPQLDDETELIVVDGNSQDGTNKIIDSYGVSIAIHISEPDKGIYDAWNKGVNAASGEWVMFIGADDMLLPNAINKYMDVLHNTKNIESYDYICANNEYVNEGGNLIDVIGGEPIWNKMRKGMSAAHVASLHSMRNLFNKVGLYDLTYHICADYELLLRKGRLKYLFLDGTHIARMTTGGMSFSMKAIKEAYYIRKKHKSVSDTFNRLLFVYYWFLFVTYKSRKRLSKLSRRFVMKVFLHSKKQNC